MSAMIPPVLPCVSASIPFPILFGASVVSLTATPVTNFSRDVSDQLFFNHPSSNVQGLDFCNITLTYTHPGQHDLITLETWLPTNTWNGNLQAQGGGGFAAGRVPGLTDTQLAGALGEGYVTSTTDGGVPTTDIPDAETVLLSPGNLDLYGLQNLASVSLNDQALISKALIKSFYGRPPKYSYWSGCSQGGRQGLMLAQRYPHAYDGIAASAPALDWTRFIPQDSWAQVYMDLLGQFPFPCELEAITAGAIKACDSLDGVQDGLVANPEACRFDPSSMVGKSIHCEQTGSSIRISHAAALVAKATWNGPVDEKGNSLYPGLYSQANITGPDGIAASGLARTTCTNSTCVGAPVGLGEAWFRLYVKRDPKWSYKNISSVGEYARLFHASVQQFDSIIGTNDPDLAEFKEAGGKLITYHGLADVVIPPHGTSNYYDRVSEMHHNVHDFYRYFQVPGLGHCSGGNGGQPTATFAALVDWVENGKAPATLPIEFERENGTVHRRILCPYPKRAHLRSKHLPVTEASSYKCT